MYDWYLGGKDNYDVDREAGQKVLDVFPSVSVAAHVNREFMQRAIRFLADEGIRQFLDIGTGIPTQPNVHQVAQAVTPDARVVYVDNDPLVLAHARALMSGATAYVDADVTTPEAILSHPDLRGTLDLKQPVAVSLVALLHFIPDDRKPLEIIGRLMDAVPSGSYLVISHATTDFQPEVFAEIERIYHGNGMAAQFRSRAGVAAFFEGLELVKPGLVVPHLWRPTTPTDVDSTLGADVSFYAGVARKR